MAHKYLILATLLFATGNLPARGSEMVLGPDQSVGPDDLAHYQSEGTVRFLDGFSLHGGSLIISSGDDFGQITPVVQHALTSPTALANASWGGNMLSVDYTVASAGLVTVELFLSDGRRVGHWAWREASSGSHFRALPLETQPLGHVFLRLTSGSHRIIQRLSTVP